MRSPADNQDVYRFTIENVPFGIQEFPQARPVVLLLLNETHGLVAGLELVPTAPTLEESKNWILQQLATSRLPGVAAGMPGLLLVQDPALYQALRFTLRASKIKVQQDENRALVEHILHEVFEQFEEPTGSPSLLEALGAEEAEDWVVAALAFCKKRPWKKLQTLLECRAVGRPEPYGVHVIGSAGNELGLILFASAEQASQSACAENFSFLLGFSLSEEGLLNAQDARWMGQLKVRPAARGWPHFLFSEECSDEDEQVFRWLLEAVPRLAENSAVPIRDREFTLSDPLAAQRERWEDFERFSLPFGHKGRLRGAARRLLTYLHHFLLSEKYERGLKVKPATVRDCEAIATVLLTGPTRRPWEERFTYPPDRNRFEVLISPSEGRWQSFLRTWKSVGLYINSQDLYYGPTIPLQLLSAELAKVRMESGWQQRLAVSYEQAMRALQGASQREVASVSENWKEWLEQLAANFLAHSEVNDDQQDVLKARLAAEKFLEKLQGPLRP